ncbi:MAG: histidinol-phosphate transaminase [Methanomassiliicoccales archaeon]|nr:histidinol-phosphate transaminase [Methanomassiliicoccales archaeon]
MRDIPLYYNPKVSGLRMDTSTNPLGANPAAKEALRECLEMDLNQYPSPYSDALRGALGQLYSLPADDFVVGNGSDEVLDIIFKSFLEPGESVVLPYPGYSLHSYFVKVNAGRPAFVDLDSDFQLDVDALNAARGKVLLLCNPNNPTSNTFRHQDIEAVIDGVPDRIVVVDEAYGEFAGKSFIPELEEYENVIVTRTFSKAYALAGMRIGYAVSNPELAGVMQRIKIPYSLNRVSEAVALKALRDQEFVRHSVKVVNEGRRQLNDGLRRLGFEVFLSEANFILFRGEMDHKVLVERLARKGVMIRDFGERRRLENCVRTTIGTERMNQYLLDKLAEVLRE